MKSLRSGFTTGSAAAFASKAAVCDLLLSHIPDDLFVMTPKQIPYSPSYEITGRGVCEVKKYAGDDPDVTDGMTIRAIATAQRGEGACQVQIDGGRGVGRVTKPGLDQEVGQAAINSTPRAMITENVLEICALAGFCGRISIIIEACGGEEVAKKTFNPKLGICGGISILGTTGIVMPMSDEAMVDTIRIEIHQRKVLGDGRLLIAFGNYGADFLKEDYGLDLGEAVLCSNFVRDALEIASDEGFTEVTLVGHLGKIVKVAGGASNTHSKYGDCRMELLAAALLRSGVECGIEEARRLLSLNTTEEAADFLAERGLLPAVMKVLTSQIADTIGGWVEGLQVSLLIYTIHQRLIAKYPE